LLGGIAGALVDWRGCGVAAVFGMCGGRKAGRKDDADGKAGDLGVHGKLLKGGRFVTSAGGGLLTGATNWFRAPVRKDAEAIANRTSPST
jgi:hypothetical protein